MGLSIGIVGLPNVGKSTLFNALSGASVLAANYPFATKDPNVGVVPGEGGVGPARDREGVETEPARKDLEALEKKRERRAKDAKAPGKPGEEAKTDLVLYDKLKGALEAGRPARSVPLSDDERARARELLLLTAKPVLSVANVAEAQPARLGCGPLAREGAVPDGGA